jgi:hypothetical protein
MRATAARLPAPPSILPKLLDVDVEQLAGAAALVALGRFEPEPPESPESPNADAVQDARDSRLRHSQDLGNVGRREALGSYN